MRKAFEEGQLYQGKLLLRQTDERVAQILLSLPRIEMLVATNCRIRNGQEIFSWDAALAAPPLHIDAPVASNLKHPSDGRRAAAVIQMRLLPDRFHHVLGQILGRRRGKAEPDQPRLHPRAKMVEQNCKCPPVAR